MVEEMKSFRPLRECGHPMDCIWFWQDAMGGIHVFCVPCMANALQKLGLKIYHYRNEEDFVKTVGGTKK